MLEYSQLAYSIKDTVNWFEIFFLHITRAFSPITELPNQLEFKKNKT